MTASSLPAALRGAAGGLYAIEAATGLIIAHASWLAREDFTRFIHVGTSISDPGTELASIDWEAAIRALDAGELPSSGGERRMLRLAASLADQAPVSLGDAITGIDNRNAGLLVRAVAMHPDDASSPDSPPRLPPPERFRTIWTRPAGYPRAHRQGRHGEGLHHLARRRLAWAGFPRTRPLSLPQHLTRRFPSRSLPDLWNLRASPGHSSPVLVVHPAVTITLEAGGAGTYTQRAIPGSEPG